MPFINDIAGVENDNPARTHRIKALNRFEDAFIIEGHVLADGLSYS